LPPAHYSGSEVFLWPANSQMASLQNVFFTVHGSVAGGEGGLYPIARALENLFREVVAWRWWPTKETIKRRNYSRHAETRHPQTRIQPGLIDIYAGLVHQYLKALDEFERVVPVRNRNSGRWDQEVGAGKHLGKSTQGHTAILRQALPEPEVIRNSHYRERQ